MTSFATHWLGDLEQVSFPLHASVCLTVKGRGRFLIQKPFDVLGLQNWAISLSPGLTSLGTQDTHFSILQVAGAAPKSKAELLAFLSPVLTIWSTGEELFPVSCLLEQLHQGSEASTISSPVDGSHSLHLL